MKASVIVVIAAGLYAQAVPSGETPLADFDKRIASYMQIHKTAEEDLGALSPTKSPKQINEKMNSIAEGVRAKRSTAAQGDVFTPAIAAEFRKLIALNVKNRPKRISQSIRSGERVAAKVKVNGSYPEGLPVQTMPPTLLASFPKLPTQLDYRLVGSTLVLRDVSANLIIDFLPNAIAIQ
jgi:hypothetical protein